MLEIIIIEALATLLLCTFTICFWKCFDVPEKTFCIWMIIMMGVLITKNSVSYVADPHHGKKPTLEDVHNGTAIIKNDTIIKKSVYWNYELEKKN